MAIVITHNGVGQGLPTTDFEQQHSVSGIDAESEYRALGVQFGMNLGGDGTSGNSMYDRADEMATQFSDAWNPAEHDWLAVNFENPNQVQMTLRGGADNTGVVPVDYEFLARDEDPTGNTDPHRQVVSTIQQWGTANGVTVDPAAITWQQAHAALVDATVYGATEAKAAVPAAKIIQWWKHGANLIPFQGSGWYNQPRAGYNTNDANGGVVDPYTTIDGTAAFRAVGGIIDDTRDGQLTWGNDFSSYPFGSPEARAEAVSFEASANSAGIGEGADIVVFQLYGGLADRPLDEIYEAPTNNSGHPTLISINANVFVTREEKRDAMRRQSRLAWLASLKTFGLRSAIGSELAFDSWLPKNLWIGLATPHDDYIDTRVDPMLEPITQAEIDRYGLPSIWRDVAIVPRHWCFWNNASDFLASDAFGGALDDPVTTRLRDNLEFRFPGGPTPNWTLPGGAWHQYLVEQLDEFGVERCRRVKQALDSARLANAAKASTLTALA